MRRSQFSVLSSQFTLVLLTLGAAAACDRDKVDPSAVDVESIIRAANPTLADNIKPLQSTLPVLFRESVASFDKTQGRAASEALLSTWRTLQNDLKSQAATVDHAAVQQKLDAIHTEELRIVMRVLGNEVVTRAVSETNVGLAEASTRIAQVQATGVDMSRATMLEQQVRQRLAAARAAIISEQPMKALDLGSQAASLLSGLDYFLAETDRIPALEMMLPKAYVQLSTSTDEKAKALLEANKRASDAARTALRAGDRDKAQQQLLTVRAQQVQIVLQAFGTQPVDNLLKQIDGRIGMMRTTLGALLSSGKDVTRYQHMLGEANDLSRRAKAAAAKNDYATSLDLASHAAGLLNTLQHISW